MLPRWGEILVPLRLVQWKSRVTGEAHRGGALDGATGPLSPFLTLNFSALPFLSNLSLLPLPTISGHFLSIYLYDINTFMLFTVCFFMAMAVTTNFISKSSNVNFDQKLQKCILQCQLISICHSIHSILKTLLFTTLESWKHSCPKFDPTASLNVFTVKTTCFSFGMSTIHPHCHPIRQQWEKSMRKIYTTPKMLLIASKSWTGLSVPGLDGTWSNIK